MLLSGQESKAESIIEYIHVCYLQKGYITVLVLNPYIIPPLLFKRAFRPGITCL